MMSKRNSQGTVNGDGANSDWPDAPCVRELTCDFQDLSDKTWIAHARVKHLQPPSLFDALHTASGTQRLEFLQAIEQLARGL
jgi:hypothetical protein